MPIGQVKWFDPKKGYGFIIGPETQDVFVHYSQIQIEGFKTLKDGQWVEYELLQGEKGWQARTVRLAQPPEGELNPTAGPQHTTAPSRPTASGPAGYAHTENDRASNNPAPPSQGYNGRSTTDAAAEEE